MSDIHRHFVDLCDIERATPVIDSYGEPIEEGNFSTIISDLECRLVEKSERVADVQRGAIQVKFYLLLVPLGTAVLPSDRVVNIRLGNQSGTTLDDNFLIEQVLTRRIKSRDNHVSLSLERIK